MPSLHQKFGNRIIMLRSKIRIDEKLMHRPISIWNDSARWSLETQKCEHLLLSLPRVWFSLRSETNSFVMHAIHKKTHNTTNRYTWCVHEECTRNLLYFTLIEFIRQNVHTIHTRIIIFACSDNTSTHRSVGWSFGLHALQIAHKKKYASSVPPSMP